MAIVFDTEVNSLQTKEVVQLATAELNTLEEISVDLHINVSKYKPSTPFEPGAVAVHRILPEDVEDCPPSHSAILTTSDYYIGHNIDFDMDVMKCQHGKRICTLALSRYLWPEQK